MVPPVQYATNIQHTAIWDTWLCIAGYQYPLLRRLEGREGGAGGLDSRLWFNSSNPSAPPQKSSMCASCQCLHHLPFRNTEVWPAEFQPLILEKNAKCFCFRELHWIVSAASHVAMKKEKTMSWMIQNRVAVARYCKYSLTPFIWCSSHSTPMK